jgi:hypothetical protein
VLSDQLKFAQIATKIATKPGADRSVSIGRMTTRAQAAENALASVRAEGLDPGVAEALLRRWASGELSDAQLDDAARQISTGELLAPPGA